MNKFTIGVLLLFVLCLCGCAAKKRSPLTTWRFENCQIDEPLDIERCQCSTETTTVDAKTGGKIVTCR